MRNSMFNVGTLFGRYYSISSIGPTEIRDRVRKKPKMAVSQTGILPTDDKPSRLSDYSWRNGVY